MFTDRAGLAAEKTRALLVGPIDSGGLPPVEPAVKSLPASAGGPGSVPGLGISPGGEWHGNPL